MSLQSQLVAQFHRPSGLLGRVAGWIMASRGSNLARNRWTVDLLDIEPDDVVCELGPGPGITLGLLLGKASHVIAVDHSPLMLSQCASRHRQAVADGRLTLHQASFTRLPPDIGQVEKMLAVNALQFDALNEAALKDLLTHLKPGGVLAVTFQPRGRAPTDADVDRAAAKTAGLLGDAGFVDLEEHRLPLEPVAAVCILARRPAA
ncbi:MAG: class I SAM-dependent methyltransferase [Pseudomonadales bacterium]|jgi:trans-aconitate methyltransferase